MVTNCSNNVYWLLHSPSQTSYVTFSGQIFLNHLGWSPLLFCDLDILKVIVQFFKRIFWVCVIPIPLTNPPALRATFTHMPLYLLRTRLLALKVLLDSVFQFSISLLCGQALLMAIQIPTRWWLSIFDISFSLSFCLFVVFLPRRSHQQVIMN